MFEDMVEPSRHSVAQFHLRNLLVASTPRPKDFFYTLSKLLKLISWSSPPRKATLWGLWATGALSRTGAGMSKALTEGVSV